jgi:hypothetical protein
MTLTRKDVVTVVAISLVVSFVVAWLIPLAIAQAPSLSMTFPVKPLKAGSVNIAPASAEVTAVDFTYSGTTITGCTVTVKNTEAEGGATHSYDVYLKIGTTDAGYKSVTNVAAQSTGQATWTGLSVSVGTSLSVEITVVQTS